MRSCRPVNTTASASGTESSKSCQAWQSKNSISFTPANIDRFVLLVLLLQLLFAQIDGIVVSVALLSLLVLLLFCCAALQGDVGEGRCGHQADQDEDEDGEGGHQGENKGYQGWEIWMVIGPPL